MGVLDDADLTEAQFQPMQAEVKALLADEKLLQLDIAAMVEELKKMKGEPSAGVDLALQEQLAALNLELTGLIWDQVDFSMVSADQGVIVTDWRVRVTSPAADAALQLSYRTSRQPGSREVTASEVEVLEHSTALAPLVAAADADLHTLLLGLYDLGRLWEERQQAAAGARRSGNGVWRLPRPDGAHLNWWIEYLPAEQRFQHMFSLTNARGAEALLPRKIQAQVRERGVQWVLAAEHE